MPAPVPIERRPRRNVKNFGALYMAFTLLSLHWAVVLYINSSFLKQFVPDSAIGVLYTASSAVTIFAFLFISRVLKRVGNYPLTLFLTFLEMGALIGMAYAESLRVAIPLFMLHQAVTPLLLFNLDVYMERMIGRSEKETGGKRGLSLAVMSFAGAIAPLAAGQLVSDGDGANFSVVYFASAFLLVPFLYIIVRYFQNFSDPRYHEIKILGTIRSFWVKRNIRNVFLTNFLLQFFFAWMVIYTPLYLNTVIGFTWSEIGIILFVALMAYVFFEYPIGLVADRYTGEKEMMFFGVLLIMLSTAALSFVHEPFLGIWMFLLFLTRTGASFVETTTESYFFKHTKGTDANIISFFRITRPLSYVVGALLGSLTLLYLPFSYIFLVLALLLSPAIVFVLFLKDTK